MEVFKCNFSPISYIHPSYRKRDAEQYLWRPQLQITVKLQLPPAVGMSKHKNYTLKMSYWQQKGSRALPTQETKET